MSVAGDYIGRVRLGVTIGVAGSQSFVWPAGRPAGTYTADGGADGAIELTVTEVGADGLTVAWAADASRRMIGHPWRLLRDGTWLFGDLYVFEAEPTDQDPAEYTVIDGTVEVRVAMVAPSGDTGGAQLDEPNTWEALQTFYSELPHTPLADIGSTEPTVMIVADDEHGELASFFGAAIDYEGSIIVSSGMRVTERDATGVPTGRYSYSIYNSLDGTWANLIAEGPTIQDIATAAKLPHVVGTPTQNDHAATKTYVDDLVGALDAADISTTGMSGLLFGTEHVGAALRRAEGVLDRSIAIRAISTTNVDVSLYVSQVVASQPTLSFDTVPGADGRFALIGQTDPHENGIYYLDEDGGWVQDAYPNVLVGPQYRLILNDPNSPADGRRWFYLTTNPTFWQRGTSITDALGEVNEDLSTEEQTVYWPLPGRWVSYEGGGGGGLDETAVQALIDAAVAALLDGAPGALDTLNELAAAINDDASFAASVTTALAGKVPTSRTITAGTGLTGGGTLAADRTLAVAYGLTADTAVEGIALPRTTWRSGSYYTTGIPFSNASVTMASGVVRAMPFYNPVASRSIDQLALDVHTASGSPGAILYVMLDDGTGYPGTVVASGAMSTPTTGTRGTTSVSYTLPRGLLWLVAHSTAATWGGLTLAGPSIYLPHQATYTANPMNCWSVTGAGTSALTSFPAGAIQSASGMQILVRAA